MTITIDVISDFVCPWCWVGKRQLAQVADAPTYALRWHPYLLHPDMPREGVDRKTFMRSKFGSDERLRELAAGVLAAAEKVGLELDFDRMPRIPDTRAAHGLMRWAADSGHADALAERLFAAHFAEGRDIGDDATLAAIAGEAGLDRAAAAQWLAAGAARDEIEAHAAYVRDAGISGVPAMILDGKLMIVGAQGPEALSQAFQQLASMPGNRPQA